MNGVPIILHGFRVSCPYNLVARNLGGMKRRATELLINKVSLIK